MKREKGVISCIMYIVHLYNVHIAQYYCELRVIVKLYWRLHATGTIIHLHTRTQQIERKKEY